MTEPICTECGLPIIEGAKTETTGAGVRHYFGSGCAAAIKRALSSASADRDRYRGVLVDLRDADLALEAASAAEDEALRTRRGREEAFAAFDAAMIALNDALAAAIAAVEEAGE